ncbi:histidine phosphatase superfamily [Thermoascus aurantiacus ATCC 26904]
MRSLLALAALPLAPLASAEKVLGVYIFARHGDRTAKKTPPTELTDLGYREVFLTGSYYRSRYVAADSPSRIAGISEDLVVPSQLSASAPADEVLQNSATGFLQGLYPPVGSSAAKETLRNGTTVEAPLDGYQLIPLSVLDSGADSEDASWLQGASNCPKAEISSNDYFSSAEYNRLLASTRDFYRSLSPMLNRTFSAADMSFRNAYAIFDYLNVASIHNSSSDFPSADLLTDDVYHRLLVLANVHEYGLAYNASEPIRAVTGAVLAGEVLTALNKTIASGGDNSTAKLNVQFGAYGTFLSFFGLAQLPAVSANFTGIPDYASSMVWELVTNSTASGFPPASEISVRFLFHNGTLTGGAEPTPYPLFGQDQTLLPWSEFAAGMGKIAISSTQQWCQACGGTTGSCASVTGSPGSDSSSATGTSSSGGISNAVAGVIGAMVTLGVVLGLEALFLLFGGFRLARKKKATPPAAATTAAAADEKKV